MNERHITKDGGDDCAKFCPACATTREAAASLTAVEQRVGAIEARTNRATSGPWRTVTNLPLGPWVDEDCRPLASDGQPALVRNWKEACLNAHFIAHAREDIPWLIAALSAALREKRDLETRIKELTTPRVTFGCDNGTAP